MLLLKGMKRGMCDDPPELIRCEGCEQLVPRFSTHVITGKVFCNNRGKCFELWVLKQRPKVDW